MLNLIFIFGTADTNDYYKEAYEIYKSIRHKTEYFKRQDACFTGEGLEGVFDDLKRWHNISSKIPKDDAIHQYIEIATNELFDALRRCK